MKLHCPACGAEASLDCWDKDPDCLQALKSAFALPPEVARVVTSYLALFRPESRALSWPRALRVIKELNIMIAEGTLRIQGKPVRACPPGVWAEAIAEMVDNRSRIKRPLKNHNYLRQVAYAKAAELLSTASKPVERAEVLGDSIDRGTVDDVMRPLQVIHDNPGVLTREEKLNLYRESLRWDRWARQEFGQGVLSPDQRSHVERSIEELSQ